MFPPAPASKYTFPCTGSICSSASCCARADSRKPVNPKQAPAASTQISLLFMVDFMILFLSRVLHLQLIFGIHRFGAAQGRLDGNLIAIRELAHKGILARQVIRHGAAGTFHFNDGVARVQPALSVERSRNEILAADEGLSQAV